MKRIVLIAVLLTVFGTLGFALSNYHETENNNDPFTADVVPQGGYSITFDGTLSEASDEDWYRFWVNQNNRLRVRIVYMQYPGVEVFIFLRFLGDLLPGTFWATIPYFDPNNQTWIYEYQFMAMTSDWHYIEVHGIGDTYPNDYNINLTNLDDPTLPVELSSFNATQAGSFVGVQWTTQSETGMSGYNVYRSIENTLDSAEKVNINIIEAANSSTTHTYSFPDYDVMLGDGYYYWLEACETGGSTEFYGWVFVQTSPPQTDGPPQLELTMLHGAYPNPFTYSSTISFELETKMETRLEIYNLRGQKIRSLHSGLLEKGLHRFVWDGRTQSGMEVCKGVYLIRLITPQGELQKKTVLN